MAGVGKIFASGIVVFITAAAHAGSVTGHGRFLKIAGNPAMGYSELYESDLFLSPSNNILMGPVRRLGAPPAPDPTTYDGFYKIDGMPAGNYSIYVNQPDFFISPKVVPNVNIPASGTVTVNVDLDVDYSTAFTGDQQWTAWDSDNYQTFVAKGSSVRGITWRMAGSGLYDGKVGIVKVLEDNGNPNPANWKLVGWGNDPQVNADSDEWVRFASGQIPLTAGKKYAVGVHIEGGEAIYKRNKDANSYVGGTAYDSGGVAKPYDLNITVFTDPADGGGDDTLVTHTRKSPGPGSFDSTLNSTTWGQSFVASGTSLAAADIFAAGPSGFALVWKLRDGGPGGAQIGPTKNVQAAFFASTTGLAGVSWNPGEISLVPGHTYYLEASNAGGFTPYLQEKWNAFADGDAYRNGTLRAGSDLAMTIMEYGPSGIHAARVAGTEFSEPAMGAGTYTPGAGGSELGFATTSTNLGASPLAGTVATSEAPTTPVLMHRGVAATTTFDAITLNAIDQARVSMMVRVGKTGYEDGDFLRIYITDGTSSIDLLNEPGNTANTSDPLEVLGDRAYFRIEGLVPDSWNSVRLVMSSSSNSTAAVEFYAIDSVTFTGVAVPEPAVLVAFCSVSFLLTRRIGLRRA